MSKIERALLALASLVVIYHFALGPALSNVAKGWNESHRRREAMEARQAFIQSLGDAPAKPDGAEPDAKSKAQ